MQKYHSLVGLFVDVLRYCSDRVLLPTWRARVVEHGDKCRSGWLVQPVVVRELVTTWRGVVRPVLLEKRLYWLPVSRQTRVVVPSGCP